ncbi:MAG: cation-translocating P-type ATPase [Desulfurococcales archaeon]|nr:cation-translocating P-type ATPase [Desulfurococcales archaeon]
MICYSKKRLKKKDIKVIMLTGDNATTAKAIARKLGIDEVIAEVLPEDKVGVIKDLQRKGATIAMVGDGINNAPALARSCVGIAMGTGTEVAIDSGDVVLMKPDLKKSPYLAELSRSTLSVIEQNVTASIVVKVTLAVLAILGVVGLWTAVLVGDMGLSLAVIANSLRLSKFRQQP